MKLRRIDYIGVGLAEWIEENYGAHIKNYEDKRLYSDFLEKLNYLITTNLPELRQLERIKEFVKELSK